jgi:hypothetical protein
MKMLGPFRTSVPTTQVRDQVDVPSRRQPRLPRDSYIAFSSNPTELHISMTIRKIEHLDALMETLQMYAPQIEAGRRREED